MALASEEGWRRRPRLVLTVALLKVRWTASSPGQQYGPLPANSEQQGLALISSGRVAALGLRMGRSSLRRASLRARLSVEAQGDTTWGAARVRATPPRASSKTAVSESAWPRGPDERPARNGCVPHRCSQEMKSLRARLAATCRRSHRRRAQQWLAASPYRRTTTSASAHCCGERWSAPVEAPCLSEVLVITRGT